MILGPIRATGGERAKQSDTVFTARHLNIARRNFIASVGRVMLGTSSWKENSAIHLNANVKDYDALMLSYNWMINGTGIPDRIRVQYSNNYGWSWKDLDDDSGIIDLYTAEINTLYEQTLPIPATTNPEGILHIRWKTEAGNKINGGGSTFAIGDVWLYIP